MRATWRSSPGSSCPASRRCSGSRATQLRSRGRRPYSPTSARRSSRLVGASLPARPLRSSPGRSGPSPSRLDSGTRALRGARRERHGSGARAGRPECGRRARERSGTRVAPRAEAYSEPDVPTPLPSRVMAVHVDVSELEAGLPEIARSPAQEGTVELVVRRPAEDEREVLEEGVLDVDAGLVGDDWLARGTSRTPDGSPPDPGTQLTL